MFFVKPRNQSEEKSKQRLEALIGKDNLENILDDIVGSSQSIVEQVYVDKIKNLYAGDMTSDNCVIWVNDPTSKRAYGVKINFSFEEYLEDDESGDKSENKEE